MCGFQVVKNITQFEESIAQSIDITEKSQSTEVDIKVSISDAVVISVEMRELMITTEGEYCQNSC